MIVAYSKIIIKPTKNGDVCKGTFMFDKMIFCDSKPYWIITEFKNDCSYSRVQLEINICDSTYELICCIVKDNDNVFQGVYYINEAFYLFSSLKPNSSKRLNNQNLASNAVCAIYLIK